MAGENDFRLQLIADLSQMERGLAKITNNLAGVVGGLRETDGAIKGTENSTKSATGAQQKFSTSLNSTRYALYDVSRTMTIAGVALLAFAAAPTKVAIDFQREFANVQRTVSGAGQDIKDQLKDLSTQIPATFKDLTQIATLGGQLGIGKSGIVQFTETVAKLTATTNLSAEVAGTALGRFKSFGLVTADQFPNLASAILKVGVNSVATETQIVGIATGIAGIGKVAGLSAATLVGYAGALASVGIQQYAARGTTQRFLSEIQKAASEGGPALDTFAKISGYSATKIQESFGTDKFNPIFRSLIQNLGDTSRTGKDLNTTLSDLGINSVIDKRTLLQLSAASSTVAGNFSDAESGMRSASTINAQYGRVAATTAAKITELGNAITNLLDTIGSQTSGPIGGFASLLLEVTKSLGQFLSTPIGQNVALLATGFALLSGVVLILGGVAARATASLIGMVTAVKGLGAESLRSTGLIAALNAELAASGPLGQKFATGMGIAGMALKALNGLFIVGVVSEGLNSLVNQFRVWTGQRSSVEGMSQTLDKAGNSYKKLIDKVVNAQGIFGNSGALGFGNAASSARQFKGAFDFLDSVNQFSPGFNISKSFDTTGIQKFRDEIKTLDQSIAGEATTNPTRAAASYRYLSQSLKDAGYSSKEIAATLPQSTKAVANNKEQIDKAAKSLETYAAATGASKTFIEDLAASTGMDEKGIQKWADAYAKSVSPLTDFNNIVKQVQTGLNDAAEAQAKAAGGDSKASDFYDGQSVSLEQFTAQLQTNNAAQQTWAQNLITISAVAGPAAAQPFIDAGYSAVNASILQQLVDATPAQRDAYIAAQQQAADLASAAMAQRILASGYIVTEAGAQVGMDTAKKLAQLLGMGVGMDEALRLLQLKLTGSPLTPVVNIDPAVQQLNYLNGRWQNHVLQWSVSVSGVPGGVAGARAVGDRPFASGGHVRGPGTGTSDSIPARLSNGEYVIKASRVRALGVSYLDGLNGGRSTAPSRFADGGPVSGGPGMSVVELGPTSLGVLRQAVRQEIGVYLGDDAIARSSNRGNARMNARGAR